MMMGPEPMIRILRISVRLGIRNQLTKYREGIECCFCALYISTLNLRICERVLGRSNEVHFLRIDFLSEVFTLNFDSLTHLIKTTSQTSSNSFFQRWCRRLAHSSVR